jgi:betaine-aldehyde dehydrogenase
MFYNEAPYGGFKESGFGKDLSMYSFEEYTQLKHIYVDLTEGTRKPWYYTVYGKK